MRIDRLLLCMMVLGVAGLSSAAEAQPPLHYLKQGWSAAERHQFYYTTQGSQLIPYDWFLWLERAGKEERFASDANMERLRFIPQPPNADRNPDGLPIGLVLDDNPETVKDPSIKQSFYSPQKPTDLSNRWLGLTCAACHTANIEYKGSTVRIDGGAAMADVQTFLSELYDAVAATTANAPVMDRFARVFLEKTGTGYSEAERDALKARMENYAPALARLVKRGKGKHPYGFARLDAFGSILNEVCDTSLNIPANYYPSDAPASFPFLWGAPQLDWVQWNGTADNPLGRNVGEVIGVFGQVNLNPVPAADRFKSTAHIENLFRLEEQLEQLQPPAWPIAILGGLDASLIAKGKKLYVQNCASCHAVRDVATNQFPLTKPNAFGKQFVQTKMTGLKEIGTDPALAMNFATRTADPGSLMPAGSPKVPRPKILEIAVGGAIQKKLADHQPPLDEATKLRINGFREPGAAPPNPLAYKARPLEGIWATAPYLHNGSVPNLYELLLPSTGGKKIRSKSFLVGSRTFDPKHVGFDTAKSAGAFEFKVEDDKGPIPGNSNAGHEGHGANKNEGYTETFENGAWREFTDDERFALIEYMKAQGPLEAIPVQEPAQIDSIVALTMQQLKNRYPADKPVLRGVHAKDHGCVQAKFAVAADLPERFRVGVFAKPGREYDSWVRFSNAATLVTPDDPLDPMGKPTPGSRGMAIKLLGVEGAPLVPPHGALTQDFLLVNHPVFAFANVEDYQVLSAILADPANKEDATKFFQVQIGKGGAAADRAKRSLQIIGRIRAADVASGAFQAQPASPVDCQYFSGAPFLFGDGAVMKFRVVPTAPDAAQANATDADYLRTALRKRLSVGDGAKPVVFNFQVQCRPAGGLDLAEDIENACNEWPENQFPFTTVATLTIPPQDFESPERRAQCEVFFFTPWHGLAEHRPIGGINRMRRGVYEASSTLRHQPKEPAGK